MVSYPIPHQSYNEEYFFVTFKICTTSKKGHVDSLEEARKLNLPIAMQLELFDTMVVPILLYGVEMWCFENCNIHI
jgi:hypothetical protein